MNRVDWFRREPGGSTTYVKPEQNDEIPDAEPGYRTLGMTVEQAEAVAEAARRSVETLVTLRDSLVAMSPRIIEAMAASQGAGFERHPLIRANTPPADKS